MKIAILLISIAGFSVLGGFFNMQQGLLPSALGFLLSGVVGWLIPVLFDHFRLHGQSIHTLHLNMGLLGIQT